jgi:hypothetical protein
MLCWIAIGLYVICQVIIVWSVYTAPTMPDDYDIRSKDLWLGNKMPANKSDKHKEVIDEN